MDPVRLGRQLGQRSCFCRRYRRVVGGEGGLEQRHEMPYVGGVPAGTRIPAARCGGRGGGRGGGIGDGTAEDGRHRRPACDHPAGGGGGCCGFLSLAATSRAVGTSACTRVGVMLSIEQTLMAEAGGLVQGRGRGRGRGR